MINPAPTPGIDQGLRLIRLRQQRMTYVFVGFPPALLVAAYVGQRFCASELAVIGAALAYGALFLVYSLRLALTECPRCEEFYHLGWWANPWTRRCLNCGLRLEPSSDET